MKILDQAGHVMYVVTNPVTKAWEFVDKTVARTPAGQKVLQSLGKAAPGMGMALSANILRQEYEQGGLGAIRIESVLFMVESTASTAVVAGVGVAAAAPTAAVTGAAATGMVIGDTVNAGIDYAVTWSTNGKSRSLGELTYTLINGSN